MDTTSGVNKRSSKPRTQYSPSDPIATITYHLVKAVGTDNFMIVGNSSVKKFLDDETVVLNSGATSKIVYSGTEHF